MYKVNVYKSHLMIPWNLDLFIYLYFRVLNFLNVFIFIVIKGKSFLLYFKNEENWKYTKFVFYYPLTLKWSVNSMDDLQMHFFSHFSRVIVT